MTHDAPLDTDGALEATEEQLNELRDLGVPETDLQDLSFADADALIAEIRAMREVT